MTRRAPPVAATPLPEVIADARRGILWMLATTFLFVTMDALAKQLTQAYPVPQVVWARYTFHAVLVLLLVGPRLPQTLASGRVGLQLLRSLLLLVTTGLFFFMIRLMPLADATALMFVTPLLVTALSVPLLAEAVGPRRWLGVLVGFAGALIIVRPGSGVWQWAALIPLAAAACNALYQIATRVLARSDRPLTTLAYSAAIGAVLSSAVVPFSWVAPDLEGWVLMGLLGLLGGISHFGLIKAFQAAPAVVVTPFGYVGLLWATGYGYLLFGDLPDRWTIVGALIIASSGLYIFAREQRRRSTPGG